MSAMLLLSSQTDTLNEPSMADSLKFTTPESFEPLDTKLQRQTLQWKPYSQCKTIKTVQFAACLYISKTSVVSACQSKTSAKTKRTKYISYPWKNLQGRDKNSMDPWAIFRVYLLIWDQKFTQYRIYTQYTIQNLHEIKYILFTCVCVYSPVFPAAALSVCLLVSLSLEAEISCGKAEFM